MPVKTQTDVKEDSQRKRRVHKKSRKGCRNCKLRRVKCDETRPHCLKCKDYGYACNYDSKTPDLELIYSETTTSQIELGQSSWSINSTPSRQMTSIPTTLEPFCVVGDDISLFELDRQSLHRLDRFRYRTVPTLGTPTTAGGFHEFAVLMACDHPFLMHALQTLTVCHDRYLTLHDAKSSRRTLTEAYHLSRAASLFNQKLCAPIANNDKDALWATAALLGIVAVSSIEASSPYEAWPLTSSTDTDLDWLRMSESKSVIFELTNPMRKESIFHVLSTNYNNAHYKRDGNLDLSSLPTHFVELFDLDEYSTVVDNPYYLPLISLQRIINVECNRSAMLSFLGFLTIMSPQYKILLKMKDPKALLLLSYWYAKVWRMVWWVERRAILECQAICIYLDRYHSDDLLIQELLLFPKRECGLLISGS
ncbi:putative c6 finger domain protein [Botrytis fragariae]|uniref:Putative c6 finger domain protein n=1 Tax=Botrytis fragariae TaxID=1964551 RepID=A0A8H6ED03_9HELO|nr:putative c6 finger domain protein [Botrytis fragariae]KAF5867794.1 putative c6 finger domain protein [Botrytis fragariae]